MDYRAIRDLSAILEMLIQSIIIHRVGEICVNNSNSTPTANNDLVLAHNGNS